MKKDQHTTKNRKIIKVIGLLSVLFLYLIPIFFGIGYFDNFINIDNWRLFYGFIAFLTLLVPITYIFIAIKNIMYENGGDINIFASRKNFKTKFNLLFPHFIGIIFLIFTYVYMLGIPLFSDLQSGLQEASGSCTLKETRHRGFRYEKKINITQENGEIIKLDISRFYFERLKGVETAYRSWDCNRDVTVDYTEEYGKVIMVN